MSALDAIGSVCGHAIDQDVADAAANASVDASDLLDQELGRVLENPLDEHGEIVLAQRFRTGTINECRCARNDGRAQFRFSYPADHGQALHDWIEEEFALAVDEEKVFRFWDDVKSKGSTRSETLNNTDNLYYVWRIVDHRRHAAAPNHEPGELKIEYSALTATGFSYADETSLLDRLNDMRLSPESVLAEKTIQVEILGQELRRQAEQSVEERQQAFEDREKLKVAETETRRLSMQLYRANEYIAELEAQNSMLRQELQRADVQADD
ncbi:hypothetical protein K4K48_009588 [Colletotrichum sp. SAR 10_66]|nr:hypothetical protein K4K48_009588 [Colletotrichum sp. SAR 10_66]